MKIKVIRKVFTEKSTIGELYIDNNYICNTLEDKDRGLNQNNSLEEIKGIKVQNETAIPLGTYKVILDYSNHFCKVLPHILDVPGYEGVRIHSGNKPEDTEGCILLGQEDGNADEIINSRVAFSKFIEIIGSNQDLTIEIVK